MQIVAALGNAASTCILLSADVIVSITTWLAESAVDVIDFLLGSGARTRRNPGAWHAPRCTVEPIYKEVKDGYVDMDVNAMRLKNPFPIKPEELIAKAKKVIGSEFGTAPDCAVDDLLAPDFQFVAPIVGPIDRDEFLRAFGSFKLREGLPDLKTNSVFSVDPLEPNRVWCELHPRAAPLRARSRKLTAEATHALRAPGRMVSRSTGTHTGNITFGGRVIEGKGAVVNNPPLAESMLFDETGRVYTLTVGYCMDRRIGNTEGLGGVFGILKAVGHALPFPEARRLYNPSLRFQAFERVAKAAECLGVDPVTRTHLPNGKAA